jgi:hypothetical protein
MSDLTREGEQKEGEARPQFILSLPALRSFSEKGSKDDKIPFTFLPYPLYTITAKP